MATRIREQAEQKQKGLTSVEAAALLLSEGHTTDPEEAQIIAEGKELNMDELMRAGLRRSMGFDFKIKVRARKILVMADDGSHLRTNAKIKDGELDSYGNIVSKELIQRLVDACVELKEKWDAKQEKANAVR